MRTIKRLALAASVLMLLAAAPCLAAKHKASTGEFEQIAEEAFVYGFPMVMNYAVFFEYFVNRASAEYKAPPNVLYNTARVYTPADTAIVTPNSDTPYSFVAMDLRTEPLVLCNPDIEKERYFSIQLVDMYTFNFGYMGSRTTGNRAACHMVAGPSWHGKAPAGIAKVFHSETEFAFAIIRTQLFNSADLDNVKKVQAGYRAVPLSKFANTEAPPAQLPVAWPKVDAKLIEANPFAFLNFILTFCPATGPASVEVPMRARFAKIGVAAGKPFSIEALSPEQQKDLAAGMKSGLEKIRQTAATLGTDEHGWRVATKGFGDRKLLGDDFTLRAAVAMAGIYGNDPAEALYPMLATDSDGNKPDTSTNRYTLTFAKGMLPPANAFWSVTMYDGKTQLLIANPIDRYLINSPMLPGMKKNADGSLTIHIQKDSPGKELESNWLPAADGPIYVVMRLYWPKEAALNGTWQPPAVQRVQ